MTQEEGGDKGRKMTMSGQVEVPCYISCFQNNTVKPAHLTTWSCPSCGFAMHFYLFKDHLFWAHVWSLNNRFHCSMKLTLRVSWPSVHEVRGAGLVIINWGGTYVCKVHRE